MSNNKIHETADVQSSLVGVGTSIWQYVVVLPGARIGKDCNICAHCFIENDVIIGDRVTVKSGVQLWDGMRVEDDVFIGSNATFTNDRFPRSKIYPVTFAQTVLHKGATIGANATLLPGIEIGEGAMIGAGAVVTRSVPPNSIAVGNPARIVGYVGAAAASLPIIALEGGMTLSEVRGVTLHELPHIRDMRGSLSVGEFGRTIPFEVKRYFLVFDVPSREVRGEHAHRACHQFLVCVSGSCSVMADDGTRRREYTLDRRNRGIYLPPMTWGVQYKYSSDAVLLVFASHLYDSADYIRDYSEFVEAVTTKAAS